MELWTRSDGRIVDVADQTARFLNVTSRALIGRSIFLFLNGDRDSLMRAVEIAFRGHTETWRGEIRPRERKPLAVAITLTVDPPDFVRWLISPCSSPREEAQDGSPSHVDAFPVSHLTSKRARQRASSRRPTKSWSTVSGGERRIGWFRAPSRPQLNCLL